MKHSFLLVRFQIPEAILANLSKEILSAVVDEKYGAIRFAFAVTTRREVDVMEIRPCVCSCSKWCFFRYLSYQSTRFSFISAAVLYLLQRNTITSIQNLLAVYIQRKSFLHFLSDLMRISAAEEDDLVMDGIHSENQLELLAHMGSRAAKRFVSRVISSPCKRILFLLHSQKPGHVVRVLLTPTNESIALIPRINDIQVTSQCLYMIFLLKCV